MCNFITVGLFNSYMYKDGYDLEKKKRYFLSETKFLSLILLQEVATKIPNVSDEGNSPIQVDSLQKPPSEDASIIIHEAKFADESKVKADLFQNETKSECGLVKEDVSVKSLQVENEDIKPTASSQDREISHLKGQDLTTNPQEIVGDYREDKTIDVTELKEEALEDKV